MREKPRPKQEAWRRVRTHRLHGPKLAYFFSSIGAFVLITGFLILGCWPFCWWFIFYFGLRTSLRIFKRPSQLFLGSFDGGCHFSFWSSSVMLFLLPSPWGVRCSFLFFLSCRVFALLGWFPNFFWLFSPTIYIFWRCLFNFLVFPAQFSFFQSRRDVFLPLNVTQPGVQAINY